MNEQVKGASEALGEAAIAAIAGVAALNGVYEGPPLQAALPFATIEAGPESDWSHKSGVGRELRLTVTIRDGGERPARLRTLVAAAEAAIEGIDGALDGWRLVTLLFLRSRMLRTDPEWTAVIDYRARLLKD